ncbi:MAG: DUF3048 domain-containing protein [Bifidobacteriaceae bacterium]|jgi:hypothetical protein|nr:DUF3048 domain-containing protein [Bifidobacteriaceae bacterium]
MRRRSPGKTIIGGCLAGLALAGLSALAGCGDEAGPGAATKTAHRVDPKDAPPPVPPSWPLTGEVGEVVERAALAVKIENDPAARPQTGLEQADLIWEELVEGGESRFIAVYNSIVPETVGPVRSVRPMDGPIMGAVRGLLACSGGQDRFVAQARDAGLQVVTEDYPGFFRSDERRMPHNLYLRPAEIWSQADQSHRALPRQEFQFAASDAAATATVQGEEAAKVEVAISAAARPDWTWQEDSGLFLRSERGTPSNGMSGTRLSAVNVIALEVTIANAGGTDAAGSPIPDTRIVGSGRGLVATGGRALEVRWSKADVASPVVLVTLDGTEVRLAVGQTWIELAPTSDAPWTVTAPEPESPSPTE